MAETVNSQITDAVTQANTKVLGEAPAVAMASIYQTLAQSAGLAMQNAVSAQQQLNTLAQAATTQAVNTILKSAPPPNDDGRESADYQAIASELAELKSALAAFEKKTPPPKLPTRKTTRRGRV